MQRRSGELIEKELAKIIIERYYLDVLSFCLSKMNDYSDAEDCTQETFMKFLSKREKLSFTDNILIWLLKTADKTIKEYNKKRSEQYYDISEYADMVTGSGVLTDSSSRLLYYDADTSSGESGAPVYVTESGSGYAHNTVVAIHTTGTNEDHPYNHGVRVNSEILRFAYWNPYI